MGSDMFPASVVVVGGGVCMLLLLLLLFSIHSPSAPWPVQPSLKTTKAATASPYFSSGTVGLVG